MVLAIERCVQVTNKYKKCRKQQSHQIEIYPFLPIFLLLFASRSYCHYSSAFVNCIKFYYRHSFPFHRVSFEIVYGIFFFLNFLTEELKEKSACKEIVLCTIRIMLTDASIYCISITQCSGCIENRLHFFFSLAPTVVLIFMAH